MSVNKQQFQSYYNIWKLYVWTFEYILMWSESHLVESELCIGASRNPLFLWWIKFSKGLQAVLPPSVHTVDCLEIVSDTFK